MKKLKNLVVSILLGGILIVSCDKEENDNTSYNYLKVGDTEYDLLQGVLENFGNHGDMSCKFDLTLLSSGFTIHESGGVFDSISGTGHGIYFVLYSSQSEKLDIGDYVYDSDGSYNSGTYDYADGVLNYNTQTKEGTYLEILSGTLSISQNAETYEISFKDNDDEISMYYKGSLNYCDYSEYQNETYGYSKSIKLKTELRFK